MGTIIFDLHGHHNQSSKSYIQNAIYRDMARTRPNIIITGTPGVGKTTHCEMLASSLGLKHLSINHIVKDRGCHDGWDEEYQSWIVDEDKV
jgi:putative protein kinase ArgK-like GTPase of G3E family